ncbi:unnamed protein product [Fusarium langsethiae]|nr:unnamed protein product [Fusarium langsethiae]
MPLDDHLFPILDAEPKRTEPIDCRDDEIKSQYIRREYKFQGQGNTENLGCHVRPIFVIEFERCCTEKPFLPKGLAFGPEPTSKTKPFTSFTLDSNKNTVAVIDYGIEVGGVPFFDVESLSGPAQIEVKYTEAYQGLEEPFSDGPLLYGNQLANNFRIQTLNVTKTGRYDVFLVQGGQRWESLRLLTEGTIKFSNVGFHATFPNLDPDKEPGFFECSDKRLNEIWKLGVRGAQSSCLEQGSQPSTWRVDPKNGVLIESLRPIQSEKAPVVGNHTLEFETKIERGGLWYGVAWEIGKGGGIGLQITGDLPKATTFTNHNYTLSPRNTIKSLQAGVK